MPPSGRSLLTLAIKALYIAPTLGGTVNTAFDQNAIVYLIDDDTQVREGLANLLQSVGLQVEAFAATTEFLARARQDIPQCLVLDVRLQGVSGLDLQAQLLSANINIPIIFITGHADIPMTVKAMKAGAIEFLTKPIREQDLLDAVQTALDSNRSRRKKEQMVAELQSRIESLTSREREVMTLVTMGRMNKQVAAEIGLSEITVKVYRHNVMKNGREVFAGVSTNGGEPCDYALAESYENLADPIDQMPLIIVEVEGRACRWHMSTRPRHDASARAPGRDGSCADEPSGGRYAADRNGCGPAQDEGGGKDRQPLGERENRNAQQQVLQPGHEDIMDQIHAIGIVPERLQHGDALVAEAQEQRQEEHAARAAREHEAPGLDDCDTQRGFAVA